VNPLTAPAFPSRTSLGPANFQSSARSRLGILPHPRRVALFEGEPRCGREHRLLDCPDELQKPGLPCAHYGEGRDHRHDAAVGDGRPQPRNSRQFDFAWRDRDQPNARAAKGSGMGHKSGLSHTIYNEGTFGSEPEPPSNPMHEKIVKCGPTSRSTIPLPLIPRCRTSTKRPDRRNVSRDLQRRRYIRKSPGSFRSC